MAEIPKPKAQLSENADVVDAGAEYDESEFHYDAKGYFLIRTVPEEKKIEAGHCKQNNVILKVFRGGTAREVCQAVLKAGLISRKDHAAYLGRECQKAELSLKLGLEYVQDDDLDVR